MPRDKLYMIIKLQNINSLFAIWLKFLQYDYPIYVKLLYLKRLTLTESEPTLIN